MNIEPIPNFVGHAQAAAPLIALALVAAVTLLLLENRPERPKRMKF